MYNHLTKPQLRELKEELLDKIDILDSLLSSTVKVEKVPETVRLSSPEEVEEYEQKGLIKENNQGYFSVLNYIEKKEIEEQKNTVYEVITEDEEYFKYFIIENAEEGDSVDMHTMAGNYLLK